MAEQRQYEELARQLSAIGAVKRDLARVLPHDCPAGAAAVLSLLHRYGVTRMSKLAELLAIDMSVTSRHVAHLTTRGWIEREPDPQDKRSRLLRITPRGEEVLADIADRYAGTLSRALADWSDEEVGRLSTLLARLRADFGDCRAPGRGLSAAGRHITPDQGQCQGQDPGLPRAVPEQGQDPDRSPDPVTHTRTPA
ncbi:MarR family winged helix-turn-helix transcriptional regulator [Streptomyces sp. URMC 123]|uniref:MarR family winged helix-turn-helix transcriptional regulator n=1 Tax=Streptomyces sp. URMC 123 TaxID=3423403 RepID=UPI003F1A1BAB